MTDLRQWHSYLGVFIAPSILFFAVSGALQLFNLHEAHGTYQPPALLEKLSNVHKDQVFALKEKDAALNLPEASDHSETPTDTPPADDEKPAIATLILKCFFLLVASAVVVSTGLGLWIGLRHPRRKRLSWVLFALGVAFPIGVLCL